MKTARFIATAAGLLAWHPALAVDVDSIDWSKVKPTEITLFYPGQSSYEWMVSANHKAGAAGVLDGKNCRECHAGEEKDMGDAIVAGKMLEPTPLAGKPGTIRVAIQAAYDAEHLYVRAVWADDGKAGVHYRFRAFADGKWSIYGNMRGESAVLSGEQPAVYEDRFSLMLGDGKSVPEFKAAGCWATCHNDMRYMPNEAKAADLGNHPYWGKDGAKKNDIRKYLKGYRSAMDSTGGWKNPKSKAEAEALMAGGYFLDLWQWRAHRTNPTGIGDDGHVAEYRNFDVGKRNFVDNWDPEKKQPKWMFDASKTGGKATLVKEDLYTAANWLTDANAVSFDPAVAKDGAAVPNWMVTSKVDGSFADLSHAKGSHDGKGWTVVMKRKLATGNKDDVQMAVGQTYVLGVAVHDDDTTARFHHVSFPQRLSLGKGDGDINAVALQ